MRLRRFFLVAAVFFIFIGTVRAGFAEDWIGERLDKESDIRRAEKKLQFSQFVEEETARAQKKSAKKFWQLNFSPSYGFDSNATLEPKAVSDHFFQQVTEGHVTQPHDGWGIFGPGQLTLSGLFESLDYHHEKQYSTRFFSIAPTVKSRLSPRWNFKMTYEASFTDYERNKTYNIFSQRFQPMVEYEWTGAFSQALYVMIEGKHYTKRRALAADYWDSEDKRFDRLWEAGTLLTYELNPNALFGMTLGHKWNNSNDLYQDYNDYGGIKLNGYLYLQPVSKFSITAFSGYERRQYDHRLLTAEPDREQLDHFFYAGSTFAYDLSQIWQLEVSFLYKKNVSNDPDQDYSGWTLSSGTNFFF